jgi:hypothetical protein
LSTTTESFYSSNRPLPPDVVAGEAAFIRFYQTYPVFSWPWAWRRTVLFGAFTVLAGIFFGISHGLTVKSVWEGVAVATACGFANIILVAAGPMLGSLVRQARLRRSVERLALVVAVIAGMILAAFADELASRFHDHLMDMHGKHDVKIESSTPDFHKIVRDIFDAGYTLFILFAANGGLALASYFAEPRRWAEHVRRVELEKASLQKNESDMRLAILQAQVEPHFLFNTLASVRSLVVTDPQRASQTIDALAEYLRATLPKLRADAGVASSTLGEQFAICAAYLELMKVRLGERLRVNIRLPAELRDTPFPPLLLISLVENAVTHGVEPKRDVTLVTLEARVIGNGGARELEVRVEDDGAGLKLGMGEGTGLANVRAQLRTRFATAASLDLTSRSSGGVTARLILPLQS